MSTVFQLEGSGIRCEAIIYPPRTDSSLPEAERYPLYLTAKRYWKPSFEQHWDDPQALTLFFLHATSFHKETWEPTIETLFKLVEEFNSGGGAQQLKIREAWCLDCPNHGFSGGMNTVTLLQPEWFWNFTCDKYAHSAHYFLTAPPLHGKPDFTQRRNVVGIGHSLGANAMSILQSLTPKLDFTSMIIVEPMLSPAGPQHLAKLRVLLIKGAYERRDVWPDRKMAWVALRKRERTKKWDPRVLKVFIEHGIYPHPGSFYKETPYDGVTLACTRDQEAAMYRDPDGATVPVLALNDACRRMPVHVIFGGVYDFMPKRTHEALTDPRSPRNFASVTTIPDAGHLMVQEMPDKLAEAVFQNLKLNELMKATNLVQSKL